MSWLQQIAIDRMPPQPWRNGGGSTRELFTWPGGTAPWQLRISVADITQDGPFSAFDGVDRWFTVLQGAGVRLGLPGGLQPLDVDSPPLQFPGEQAPGCWLTDGPTRDLNLMLQRGAGQACMLPVVPGQAWQHPAPLRALLTTTPVQLQIDDKAVQPVGAWTLALAGTASRQRWTLTTPAGALPAGQRACWLAFTPAPR